MRLTALFGLVARDARRTAPGLLGAAGAVAVGITALVFFVALDLGARRVLLGEVFPIDQVELEPRQDSAGLFALLQGRHEPPGIAPDLVTSLRERPGVVEVLPKLRFRFPGTARGGKGVLGRDLLVEEVIGDGIERASLDDPTQSARFVDPWDPAGPRCTTDRDCDSGRYCEWPSTAPQGRCSRPVPVLVSRYMVELFDHGLAPSHGLPPIGESLVRQASGLQAEMELGESALGVAHQGKRRRVRLELIGMSPKAIDLGVTLPIEVVRRWNREYSGESAATSYSSVVVRVERAADVSRVIDFGAQHALVPRDTRARDVSVLIQGALAVLLLGASAVLAVAALTIAETLRTLVLERSREIALYRALGARRGDMRAWIVLLALLIASAGTLVGCALARLLGLVLDRVAVTALPDFPFKPDSFFAFTPGLWLVAFGFGSLFALLGAIGPALRAGRVDPARTLTGR